MASRETDVLYLSYDGLTDPLGQSQILPYLIGLASYGHKIHIVSFEKPERYAISEASIRKLCEGAGIIWHPQTYHKKPSVVSTLYDLLMLWRVSVRITRDRRIRIVHCRSYLTALIGLAIKKRETSVKMIFDMRGFWADERIEGEIWTLTNPVYRFIYNYFKRAERRLVKGADYVIVLTQAANEEIARWKLNNHIEVIACCVDLTLFDPKRIQQTEQDDLRRSLGFEKDDFVLLYLGSLGTWYMMDEMLAFFQSLRASRPDAKFLFLTPDLDAVAGEGIITLTAQRKDVPNYIAIADASICFIKPTFSKKGSSATKVAEVLAMNVPVICNGGWGDQEFLQSRVNGLLVTNPEAGMSEKLFLSVKRGDSQTDFFREYFSLDKGVERYHTIYRILIDDLKLSVGQNLPLGL
jgi:glycosyltransferase involved in cell wall biosynthesis